MTSMNNRKLKVEKYFNKYLTQNKGNHRTVRGFGDQSTDFCHLRAREYEILINENESNGFQIKVGMHIVECNYDKNGNVHHMIILAAMRKLNSMMSDYEENFRSKYLPVDPWDPMYDDIIESVYADIFGIRVEQLFLNYKKQFKRLAKIHHPDYGGNAIDFDFFVEMRQMLESHINLCYVEGERR